MDIEASIRVWREGNAFVAHAMPIDISSAGDTPIAARHALREAIGLFIATARDHGTLNDVLDECGYRLENDRWIAPKVCEQHDDLLVV